MSKTPREVLVKKLKLVVLKVGTRLIGNEEQMSKMIDHIDFLRKRKIKVVLVSSGAVGLGLKTMGITRRPSDLGTKQALAAIGQSQLMNAYAKQAQNKGFAVAQLLLTANDLQRRDSQLNVLNCLSKLLEKDVLPIINENDSVATQELKVGDNDTLAGYVATLLRADLTILLTKVDGLFKSENGELTERISYVKTLNKQLLDYAKGTEDSLMSTGGMSTKLQCAKMILEAGDALYIADGHDEHVMQKIMEAQDVGTLFYNPEKEMMCAHKRYIRFFSKVRGKIYVDAGAYKAVFEKQTSLLLVGLRSVQGTFAEGDVVEICGEDGVAFARGVTNYDFLHCAMLSIEYNPNKKREKRTLVHRNNMVIYDT